MVSVAEDPKEGRVPHLRVHLDTDFGGDPDDACALAMLLGWPGVELVGITTTIDHDGRRAAYVRHVLDLVGRSDIPVAAGAGVSLTTQQVAEPFLDARYWPTDLPLPVSPPGAALDLLAASIAQGAHVIGIGPLTNLALLEIARPGTLRQVLLTIMGGWVFPPGAGLPDWGPEMDFNVQWDVHAARIVTSAVTAAELTLTPIATALRAPLRAADLPRLRASGPLGELLAQQSVIYAAESGMAELGLAHAALPDDLLNIHWDPLACAVALGWSGATVETLPLTPLITDDVLRFHLQPDPAGRSRPLRVVTAVDGAAFSAAWLAAVEAAQR